MEAHDPGVLYTFSRHNHQAAQVGHFDPNHGWNKGSQPAQTSNVAPPYGRFWLRMEAPSVQDPSVFQ